MDTPGLTQFKQKSQFVIQTAWLLSQWFSVRLSPCRLSFCFFSLLFSGLGVTFIG